MKVFYRVHTSSDAYQDSEIYRLTIKPPEAHERERLQCLQASSRLEVSLATARSKGLTLRLERWLLMEAGQRLWVAGTFLEQPAVAKFWATQGGEAGQLVSAVDIARGYVELQVANSNFGPALVNHELRFDVQLAFEKPSDRQSPLLDFPPLTLRFVA
ncbi:hypothetical protein [Pseudomonas sp. KNUC1026]|uniref:hypothetical protein n=1 Tax=Pseudomonas sp. KNUC1026 TaxID=2893890 RepID=UPI001F2CE83C|nr:hypothetical protein [Pseudomonas sp. KNUC1026]UFH48282.1 hypothetical protein LN139_14020 [Pseudomonas sp. KNUC1026]